MRQAEQAIGLTRHRAHDQYDLVSLSLRAQRKLGNVSHSVEIGDRSTTEFLNNESHAASLVAPTTGGVKSDKRCYRPARMSPLAHYVVETLVTLLAIVA